MLVPILLVTNAMFPIAWLPDTSFVMRRAIHAHRECPAAMPKVGLRERPFDISPTDGEVVIVVGQSPQAVKMIREQDASEHVKGVPFAHLYHGSIEHSPRDGLIEQSSTSIGNDGKEITGTRVTPTYIIRHASIVEATLWRVKPSVGNGCRGPA